MKPEFTDASQPDGALVAKGMSVPEAPERTSATESARDAATPARFVKKFLVQFEAGADTRWLNDDQETAACLKFVAGLIATSHTDGPVPGVVILKEV